MSNQAAAALMAQWAVQTGLLSLGVILVAVLRPILRRGFGAQAACAAWILVPVLCACAWLPALPGARVMVLADAANWLPAWNGVAPKGIAALPASGGLSAVWVAWGVALWLLGAAAVAWRWRVQQRRALAQIVWPRDAGPGRLPAGHSPALVGAWAPRLALPLDFEARFDADERRAILTHEAAHAARHDNRWSLLAHALTALHWFNPLAWWALARLRADQELACDAAVLSSPGSSLRVYARALAKSQQLSTLLPLAARWRTHPLIERMNMLDQHHHSAMRRRAGLAMTALLAGATLALAPPLRAGTAVPAEGILLQLTLEHDGTAFSRPRLWGEVGKAMTLRWQTPGAAEEGHRWELTITPSLVGQRSGADPQMRDLQLQIQLQASPGPGKPLQPLAQPRLITALGTPVRVEASAPDGLHRMGVTVVGTLTASPAGR